MTNKTPIEHAKENSNGLKSNIANEIENRITQTMDNESYSVAKNFGLYMQDNRDRRLIREHKKLEMDYHYKARLVHPTGYFTAEEFTTVFDAVNLQSASSLAGLKISNRQTFQIYGITKPTMKKTLQLLDTVNIKSGVGGDLVANIALCSYSSCSKEFDQISKMVYEMADMFEYKSSPYNEIFLDKKSENTEDNKFYGTNLLPRKLKIAITIPPHNEVDALTNDIAIIAVHSDETNSKLMGYNVLIGGGMGVMYDNIDTYAQLAKPFAYVEKDQILQTVMEIAKVQRDNGNRSDRNQARVKYTIRDMGFNTFKSEVAKNLDFELQEIKEFDLTERNDNLEWVVDTNNTWSKTIFLQKGYLEDYQDYKAISALLEITKLKLANIRVTGQKNIRIVEILPDNKKQVDEILAKYNVKNEYFTQNEQIALACNGLPSCPLALSESSRFLSTFVKNIQEIQEKTNIGDKQLSIRVSGCPNACARTYSAEIGLTGVYPNIYSLWLGGNDKGTRLGKLYKSNIHEDDVLKELQSLFKDYSLEKDKLSFGDYCHETLMFEN